MILWTYPEPVDKCEWHDWYAWYPVMAENHLVIFQKIQRRRIYYIDYTYDPMDTYKWIYRLLPIFRNM